MTTGVHPTVVGVFTDRTMAEQAMQDLYNSGFSSDQVRYSGSGYAGSFLEGIKSLFTGPVASGGDLANDLSDMGLSDDEARYYANEYSNGRYIVAVKTPEHEQEAMSILHRYGAYEYRSGNNPVQPTQTPRTTQAVQEDRTAQTVRNEQTTPTSDYAPTAYNDVPVRTNTPRMQANRPLEQRAEQTAYTQKPSNVTGDATHYQDFQTQIQQVQSQLKEAQARLQAAKERETQLRTQRERETQYQEQQKQLQDMQQQLQSTLAELRETESRLSQYS